jgi:putative pyruvate formate lyase activating enzyme
LPFAREAVERVVTDGVRLPVVCNTSGFERVETLEAYEDLVDVYLTDLRYAEPGSAEEGSGVASYAEVARAALREMWRQKGPLRLGADGLAEQGTIVRLLVLPGRADEALANLRWLAETVGTEIAVSVMAQYVPVHRAPVTAGWDRRVSRDEYERVCTGLETLGFGEGWVQEWGSETPKELLGFEMVGTRPAGVTNGEHA